MPVVLSAQISQPGGSTDRQESRLTPQQAKQLFRSVDEILHFVSQDSGLDQKQNVKRRLTSREGVEKYLLSKLNDDRDAKRTERSELVLKKFGLLDRDFHLQPFLISLLKEQIAGYYDSKTKTVNLLDWVDPDLQKGVLAHELTHALQDQRVNLEKWNNQTPITLPVNTVEDNRQLRVDEADDTREAVLEGQAMAVFIDYSLEPRGQSITTSDDVVSAVEKSMTDSSDSPIMSRAPLLLQESLIFPYREGLNFIQQLLKDRGKQTAFAETLDHPPSTSWEILNPQEYEQGHKPPTLSMPDVHPLLGADYAPYDIGAVGQLDLKILATLYGGPEMVQKLAPAWDGGYYYAAKIVAAGNANTTASIATLYVSNWKNEQAARTFAAMYADNIARKYPRVHGDESESTDEETVWQTGEGPVMIAIHGKQIIVTESFDLATARKLDLVLNGAAGGADTKTARLTVPQEGLSDGLISTFANAGLMKTALRH